MDWIALILLVIVLPWSYVEALSCTSRGTIADGTVTCTNGNEYTSVCTASCDDSYQLVGTAVSQCLVTGQWDQLLPECQQFCPPYSAMDMVIVLDSSSSIGDGNWVLLKQFMSGIISSFTVAPDAANFAIFRYNRNVDTNTQIFLNDYPGDVGGLLTAFSQIPYDGSGTSTGNALRHALEVSLSAANGNKPGFPDIVLLVTDGKSADGGKTQADNLRAAGATVLVLGIEPPQGQLDLIELMDIAGEEQNLVLASGGFDTLDTALKFKLTQTICG